MNAWRLDGPTWLWIGWIAYFAVLEGWAIVSDKPVHTLTHHLRPLFIEHPLTWFVGLGAGLWLIVHVFTPALERWLIDAVGRGAP